MLVLVIGEAVFELVLSSLELSNPLLPFVHHGVVGVDVAAHVLDRAELDPSRVP